MAKRLWYQQKQDRERAPFARASRTPLHSKRHESGLMVSRIPDVIDLGPCCICALSEGVHTAVHLPYRGTEAGEGWGCEGCGLPPDGALAMLCDLCLAAYPDIEAALIYVVKGDAFEHERMLFRDLPREPFLHQTPSGEFERSGEPDGFEVIESSEYIPKRAEPHRLAALEPEYFQSPDMQRIYAQLEQRKAEDGDAAMAVLSYLHERAAAPFWDAFSDDLTHAEAVALLTYDETPERTILVAVSVEVIDEANELPRRIIFYSLQEALQVPPIAARVAQGFMEMTRMVSKSGGVLRKAELDDYLFKALLRD